MKYCTECGHENADNVKFCESCGHGFAESETPAQQPVAQQAATEMSAAVKKTSEAIARVRRPSNKVIVIGVGALALLLVAWIAFFRPASASAYEARAEDHLLEISDGLNLIGQGVSGLYSYGYDEKMTADEYATYREDIEDGIKMASRGAKGLRSLRAPGEHKTADRRLKAFASYVLDDIVPGADRLVNDVEPGMTGERLDTRIVRYFEQRDRGAERAYENLYRAADDIYIPGDIGRGFYGSY